MSDQDSQESSGEFIREPLNIDRCAALHDTIAALQLGSPYIHPRYRLQKNFWEVHSDIESLVARQRLTADLNEYLSAISVFAIDDEQLAGDRASKDEEEKSSDDQRRPGKKVHVDWSPVEPTFTPALRFPYPHLLYLYEEWPVEDYEDDEILQSTVVLLYPSIKSKGGLFFDMSTNLCCWTSVEGPTWPERPREWISLECALTRYLYCWESGRYAMELSLDLGSCDFTKPFAKAQLDETVTEWEALLQAIENRMPPVESRQGGLEPPAIKCLLDSEELADDTLLQTIQLVPPADSNGDIIPLESDITPCFLLAFLGRARRPNHANLRIAPSITYFQASTIRASLLRDLERRNAAFDQRGDFNNWFELPFLLFPYIGGQGGDRIVEYEEWQHSGFEHLLVDNRPGLYCIPELFAGWFDGVKFISRRPLKVEEDDVRDDVPGEDGEDESSEGLRIGEGDELNLILASRSDGSQDTRTHGNFTDIDAEQVPDISQMSQGGDERRSRCGNDVLFSHDNFFQCPYFGRHNPRLVDVLRAWRRLVENDIVAVGPDGVEGNMEDVWEETRRTRRGLSEFDIGRCW